MNFSSPYPGVISLSPFLPIAAEPTTEMSFGRESPNIEQGTPNRRSAVVPFRCWSIESASATDLIVFTICCLDTFHEY